MKKKLFAAAALLGIALVPSFAPQAEAVGYCSASYCAGKPPLSQCGCPPDSGRPGFTTVCGFWDGFTRASCR